MQIARAFLALLAGFIAMALLVAAATAMLTKLAPQWVGSHGKPRPGYGVFHLIYSMAAACAGGYVTAWLTVSNPLIATLALALVVLLLGALSALQQRGRQPIWYQLTLVAIAPAGVFLGGVLRLHAIGVSVFTP